MPLILDVNSCWAQALLPLSPLQQANLSGRIYSEGTGVRNCSLAMTVQRLDDSPAEMTSALSPHLWLIGWRFHSTAETIHY